ncbi:MAG: hypothetical protein COU22_02290 [Candidatus Komeilibacteria bacterium CG10_big_fil_rev_8_21_14_0_10_41_13]|uniref:Uncharacterized protein n=1 Tax=Candidatus Komeilibacteria bacterium CG10_big_fil_rev_8_21_14_0_10_41_13 TaxID=1974476 RepID=A0A2M6WC91_9BACT|nr:MAG: hypothetical protein COU22_02290 [Candidatus Komeilibacteria bacterium CG10_big_fil_rev_8_21_14_0_10_41_13]
MDEQIKKLLEQNLAYSKQIYLMNKKIKKYILFGKVMSLVYLLLIIIPIILGVVYLPGILSQGLGQIIPSALGNQSGLQAILGDSVNQADLIKTIKEQGGPLESYKNILDLYNQ